MRLSPIIRGLAFACAVSFSTGAQTFSAASTSARQDLEKALAELSNLQKKVAGEKIPLSQQLSKAEEELSAARKEYDRAQRARDNELVDLNSLKTEVKQTQDQIAYLGGLLTEYARLFETRVHIAELGRYEKAIGDARSATENPDLSPADRLERQLGLVRLSMDRVNELLGGAQFEGKALTPAGVLEKGRFALAGPVVLFASDESGAAGPARTQINSAEASVADIGPELIPAVRAVVTSGAGELPFDPTLGNALKIAATKEPLMDHIRKGGPVMYPIVAIGLVAMLIALVKWLQLAGIRTATTRDLQIILDRLNRGDDKAAMDHATSISGPAGDLLKAAVAHADEKKEYIEEVLYEKMLNTKPRLERMMPFIALTAATAPLLGLLGTVTGMINTFNMISVFGTGDPKTLSGGISEALITTEYGLIVAIPCLLVHSVLSRKVKGILGSMEQTTVAFINGAPDRAEAIEPSGDEPLAGEAAPATA